ncbi:DUF6776 family protein [Aliiglaciecola litoralis]|uniref:MSHA biogenesis protein MshJ n=1 Tax=Aliiglaciecola litoralis TaxID=582857 RepID=A0ABN1LSH4_9ALTE
MIPEDIRKTWGAFKFYTLLLALFGIAIYLSFTYGNHDNARQQAEIATLKHTMDNLAKENQRLTRELNILGVELEVQRLAAQKLQVKIQQDLAREAQLKQENQFYQKVMAPELTQDGFVIEAFDVQKSQSDNGFRYELVLMQQDKIKSVVKGDVKVTLVGSLNGQPTQLDLSQLATEESQSLSFSFKYFQTIKGEIILPDGFTVERVKVNATVYQFKRKRGELETSFEWQPRGA